MTEDWIASKCTNGLLVVLVAALSVFVVATPIVSSKLDALAASEFTVSIDKPDPACLPSEICFRILNQSPQRTTAGVVVPLRIEGADNVFAVARDLADGSLRVTTSDDTGKTPQARIEPHYNLYFNSDEVLRRIPASLLFQYPPAEHITLAFVHAGIHSELRTLHFARNHVGTLGALISDPNWAARYRYGGGLLILLLTLITSMAEVRARNTLAHTRGTFASALILRWAVIGAAGQITSPAICLLIVLAALLPWLVVARWAWQLKQTTRHAPIGWAKIHIAPIWHARRWNDRLSILELVILTIEIGVFAYMLWLGPSFRWSIFEERDFIEAQQVANQLKLPVYGPELLLGGRTIGSGLYLMLTPVVALWNDPEALLLLNRLLFLGMALALWWGIRNWTGPAGALFAVFALVASERVVALSYWPIHPNFSLFFGVIYGCALLRGSVDGKRSWLISSGLMLGILVQLHFSYFLLLPSHIALVAIGNCMSDRWSKPLAILAVFIPLSPFLVIDALQGFPNIAQIAEQPRFHGLYPNRPFGNVGLISLVFGWFKEISGPFASGLSMLAMLLATLGTAIGIGSVPGATGVRRGSMTPALAAATMLSIPAFELTVLGMGYNTRHTLSMAPALFMLAGFGFAGVVSIVEATKQWIGRWLLLPLAMVLCIRASNSAVIEAVSRSEGEWAIDYRSRQMIARDLIVRLGMSPETYAARTYWWWVGWSVDPEIYHAIYRRVVAAQDVPNSILTSDQFVLVTDKAQLPPFLENVFEDVEVRPIGGMYIHIATPKENTPFAMPSANADSGVRLHSFLERIDQLRIRTHDIVRIGHERVGLTKWNLFLATIAAGRIKLLITTQESKLGDRERLRWCVDSPFLNGHYQEFKSIWRPRLILTPASGVTIESSLARDVLGSLLYKTPRCGEAWSDSAGPWQMSLAFDGLFDQSFMLRPDLTRRRWHFNFDAPLLDISIPAHTISGWTKARFGN